MSQNSGSPAIRITSESIDGRSRIVVAGEIDIAGVDELESHILVAERSDASAIVLDLSEVEFIDSSGIKLLLEAARRDPKGLRLSIVASRAVQRVLELTGLAEALPLGAASTDTR